MTTDTGGHTRTFQVHPGSAVQNYRNVEKPTQVATLKLSKTTLAQLFKTIEVATLNQALV